MPAILLQNVDKFYGNSRLKAVSSLDLEIEDGDFMCLLGPSGCGKTTTLRMIAGLENLSAGEISVAGKLMDSIRAGVFVAPEKRGMGLVFQSYALWPHLTVEKNTDFGLRLRRVPEAERKRQVDHVMSTLGIEAYRDRYPSQLSGGQQQRVALARMLVVNPQVLLLDEPLSNLDARLRLEMRTELKRIHGEFGSTVVFVTHDQWEAMTLATRIAVMHEGTLQQVGSPDEIYQRPANRFVAEFVGSPPINIIDIAGRDSDALPSMARAYLDSRVEQPSRVASMGLRPESIRLLAPDEDARGDGFSGSAALTAVLPTGGSWIMELDVDGARLFVTASRPPSHAVGDSLRFYIEREALHLFDGQQVRIQVNAEPPRQVAS